MSLTVISFEMSFVAPDFAYLATSVLGIVPEYPPPLVLVLVLVLSPDADADALCAHEDVLPAAIIHSAPNNNATFPLNTYVSPF